MIKICYAVKFTSPVHIGAGYGFAGFLDSVVVRNTQKQIYIPGSTLKGKTRAAMRRMADAFGLPICTAGQACGLRQATPCPVCTLLGSSQLPGTLYFDDVALPAAYQQLLTELQLRDPLAARQALTDRRTGVMLNRRRRAANPDYLFTNEIINVITPLTGSIVGAGQLTAADIALLWAALESITHLGRAGSRGLGGCKMSVETVELAGQPLTRDEYTHLLERLPL